MWKILMIKAMIYSNLRDSCKQNENTCIVYAVAAVGRRTFCIYFELSTLTAIEFL